MLRFVVRRLLLLVPILLGLSILVFLWIRALPGSPAIALLGERATPEAIAQINRQYGLDKPLPVQYWHYLKKTSRGQFGESTESRQPVVEEFKRVFPRRSSSRSPPALLAHSRDSARLPGGQALPGRARPREPGRLARRDIHAHLLPRPDPQVHLRREARLATERRANSVLIELDHPTNFYVLDAILAGNWEAFVDTIKHLILPAIALGSIPLAIIARITRAAVLDVQNEDYVRTARAKGLPPITVDYRHVLRNAMLPISTIIGLQVGLLLSGAVLTETVFAFPGIGSWLVEGIKARDYPVIQAGVLFVAVIVVFVNLLVDVSYGLLNPNQAQLMSVIELEARDVAIETAPSGLWSDAWYRLKRNPGAIAAS